MSEAGDVPEEEQIVSECESDLLTQAEYGNKTAGSGGTNQAVIESDSNDVHATKSVSRASDIDTTTAIAITNSANDGPADSTNPDFELREATSCSDSDSDNSYCSTDDDDLDTAVDQGLSLAEKRNRNIQRHRDVLDRLDLAHGISLRGPNQGAKTKRKSSVDLDTPNFNNGSCADAGNGMNATHSQRPQGMLLFPGGCLDHRRAVRGRFPRLDRADNDDTLTFAKLCELYPHRENLIRKLRDILSVPLLDANCVAPDVNCGQSSKLTVQTTMCAPPPIFITGPSGCGKTAIVQDVLEHVTHQCSRGSAARAYVDCTTLDVCSMEEFVGDVQGQFAMQFLSSSKRSRQIQVASPDKNASVLNDQRLRNTRTTDTVEHSTTAMEPARHRRTSGRNHGSRANQEPSVKATYTSRHNKHSRAQLESGDKGDWTLDDTVSQGQRMTAPMLAAWALGCALERWLRRSVRGGPQAAFLVIDNAERLLSLAGSSRHKTAAAAENVNFLAQLLLLPRVLQLNLTLIVITKSVLLEHSSTFINNDSCTESRIHIFLRLICVLSFNQHSTTCRLGEQYWATSAQFAFTFPLIRVSKPFKRYDRNNRCPNSQWTVAFLLTPVTTSHRQCCRYCALEQ
jgi:hypothetical protein